jgi:HEAT repeat protein
VRELVGLTEESVDLNFDAVFFLAREDEDAEVRLEAVRGLWEYEGPNLIGPLLKMMEGDEDARVRAEASLALGRFVLLAEYGRLGDRYFEQVEAGLRRKVEDASEVAEVRGRALEAISTHDGAWVRQAISGAYESGVRGLKVSAVHAMGRSCQGRWLPLILRELSNEEPEVRYEAAVACGLLGEEEAVGALGPLLADPDEEVKEAAITALGEIGGGSAKELLMGLADDSAPGVREAAADALREIGFADEPLSIGHGE